MDRREVLVCEGFVVVRRVRGRGKVLTRACDREGVEVRRGGRRETGTGGGDEGSCVRCWWRKGRSTTLSWRHLGVDPPVIQHLFLLPLLPRPPIIRCSPRQPPPRPPKPPQAHKLAIEVELLAPPAAGFSGSDFDSDLGTCAADFGGAAGEAGACWTLARGAFGDGASHWGAKGVSCVLKSTLVSPVVLVLPSSNAPLERPLNSPGAAGGGLSWLSACARLELLTFHPSSLAAAQAVVHPRVAPTLLALLRRPRKPSSA